jgi:hypothetical protein
MIQTDQVQAAIAGLGITEAHPELLAALIEYEIWRLSFRAGSGALVSTEGQVFTGREVVRQVAGRRRRVRKGGRNV